MITSSTFPCGNPAVCKRSELKFPCAARHVLYGLMERSESWAGKVKLSSAWRSSHCHSHHLALNSINQKVNSCRKLIPAGSLPDFKSMGKKHLEAKMAKHQRGWKEGEKTEWSREKMSCGRERETFPAPGASWHFGRWEHGGVKQQVRACGDTETDRHTQETCRRRD